MIKKILTVLFLLPFLGIQASPVDLASAKKAAINALKFRSLQFQGIELTPQVKEIKPLDESMAYVVNFVDGGFVLIAADDASKPILGYSFSGTFNLTEIPPVVAEWMQFYYRQIRYFRDNNIQPTDEIRKEWNDLFNGNFSFERDNRDITPLITTTWDQSSKYNSLCPSDPLGPGGHVYSGCVATAMSQVINYWRYPLTGTGNHGYYSDYGYLFVDYSTSDYKYHEMNSSINSEENYEMAEIQYHCGVAVDMMYSPTGSGAYSDDAAAALRNYFGYSSDLTLVFKDDYSDSAWQNLLISNLNNGWPMYYHGFGSGGHAFNVDGCQGNDYFHFNWGWSGSFNGYFYLTNLNPGGSDFTWGQGAIVNFHPAVGNYPYYCSGTDTLTRHSGTIEDGSGPVDNYISGLNCGWLISPMDSVTGLTLYFDKFDLAAGDVVNVYDGSNSSFPLVGSFTGNTVPAQIASQSGSLYMEFLSSGALGKGFKAHYVSYLVNYCPAITHLTEPTGSFTDGSGNREYRNKSICKYLIEPENAATITISFNSFQTDPNDKVKIYDMISQTLLGEFSGSELPDDILIPSRKGYVLFVSDEATTDQGWDISYTSTVISTQDVIADKGISFLCTPNPASDFLRLEVKSEKEQIMEISLISAEGVVRKIHKGIVGGNRQVIMHDVSTIPAGLYLLKYKSEMGSGSLKVIIQ